MNNVFFHTTPWLLDDGQLPEKFNFPTNYEPHTLAMEICKHLQKHIQKNHSPNDKGRMYGVLIVRNLAGEIGFLAAYSGQDKQHDNYFVPPIYDRLHPQSFFGFNEDKLSEINQKITEYLKDKNLQQAIELKNNYEIQAQKEITNKVVANRLAKSHRNELRKQYIDANQTKLDLLIKESQTQKSELNKLKKDWKNRIDKIDLEIFNLKEKINTLKIERQLLSQQTQKQLFDNYKILNFNGISKSISTIFREQTQKEPPAGTGDCCAPKLLNFAYQNQLTPITMAEFWWGKSPKNEIRKHLQYYPACRGKCEPLLNHMLEGLPVDDNPLEKQINSGKRFSIVYEDNDIAVIEKPHNLLSVPGIITQNSVLEQAKILWANATEPIIVHRLDWATSGLMVLSKNKEAYLRLQNQFLKKTVHKRYTALLAGKISKKSGEINLPLRVDLNDRPRQMVCETHGKKALTRFEVMDERNNVTRIHLYPITGRTHQLRVHMAHHLGLNCPIIGDFLYGNPADRLYLQADQLAFTHPISNEKMFFEMQAEF